jgi:hypothetical protein
LTIVGILRWDDGFPAVAALGQEEEGFHSWEDEVIRVLASEAPSFTVFTRQLALTEVNMGLFLPPLQTQ